MLYGRRLDDALGHVDGSRYALVHAVAKRARQITLWLTADPAELRAESAPPPAPGELISRDPVALAEAEILQGEVGVRWDPEGLEDGAEDEVIETDPLLIEAIADDDEDGDAVVDLESSMTPALAQALDGEEDDADGSDADLSSDGDDESDADGDGDGDGADLGDLDVDDDDDRRWRRWRPRRGRRGRVSPAGPPGPLSSDRARDRRSHAPATRRAAQRAARRRSTL